MVTGGVIEEVGVATEWRGELHWRWPVSEEVRMEK
jgi:hypothetical protein